MTEMDLEPIAPERKQRAPRKPKPTVPTDVVPAESAAGELDNQVAPVIIGEGVQLSQPAELVEVPRLVIERRVPLQHVDSDPLGDLPHQSR